MEINGGAVEVSWVVRTDDSRAITDCNCADPRIARVRIDLLRTDDGSDARPCAGRAACEFSCQRGTGATPFDIPPGNYAISVRPLGPSGEELSDPANATQSVRVPDPILQDVVRGQPTDLGAFFIQARCAPACSGTNSNGVCTSK